MPNGKTISLIQAQQNIRAFVKQEQIRTLKDEKKIVVGQKIDLDVLKKFIEAIDHHEKASEIDAIRIYFAKSTRGGQYSKSEYDVVIVPVLRKNYGDDYDYDLHAVYPRPEKDRADPIILGNSLPCPNVCPPGKKNLGCIEGEPRAAKRPTSKTKRHNRKK